MASKSQRQARRRKQKHRAAQANGPVDPHVRSVLKSMGAMGSKMIDLARSNDPAAAITAQLTAAVDALSEEMEGYNRFQVCEGARQSGLPWSVAGVARPDTEGGAVVAELLTLIAFAGAASTGAGMGEPLSPKLESWGKSVNDIIQMASIDRLIAATANGTEDPMAKILVSMRGSEVWIRNSSYPQMVEATLLRLFDTPDTKSALEQAVGFDAASALKVMNSCHTIQVDGMNVRLERCFKSLHEARDSTRVEGPDRTLLKEAQRLWDEAWEPKENQVTVSGSAMADLTELPLEVVEAVVAQFALELDDWTPQKVVREFTSGNNPLRTNPILRNTDGRVMLVHDALVPPAVRENLEQVLKGTSAWDGYAKHRGSLLEELAGQYLTTMMPGAQVRAGFEYFTPASTDESAAGQPAGYTRLVEGDLLLVKDDVAVIVEAKAVALAPSARAGQTRRLRRNLTRIITDAAEQASRLKVLIERDHGFRLRNNAWVDLTRIREIHTIAVSLDDLPGVATTTADLIEAGLLDPAEIPWTVSLHDLQIISELVDAPAEFLLYLRRRRDPEATVVYMAPDELDLFLYFFEKGLYVAPDPELMKLELNYVTEARTGDVRRRRNQRRQYISTRTDALDAWFHYSRGESEQPASKPALSGSPMHGFVKELQKRGDYGWLSIGATLLSGATKTQADWARNPARLLSSPRSDGRETTLTVPFGTTREDAWLLVWATQPLSTDPGLLLERMGSYLRAKKYQFGLRRGCVFVFDTGSKELSHVLFDDTLPAPDPEMDEAIKTLFPIDKMSGPVPPKAKKRGKRR